MEKFWVYPRQNIVVWILLYLQKNPTWWFLDYRTEGKRHEEQIRALTAHKSQREARFSVKMHRYPTWDTFSVEFALEFYMWFTTWHESSTWR